MWISADVYVQYKHFHTILHNPFFIELGVDTVNTP